LPSANVLTLPVTCFPAWHTVYGQYRGRKSKDVVVSGCATVDGNVTCAPSAMASHAGVSLGAYTLARYLASEVGSGSAEEKVAVAQAAVNRVLYVENMSGSLEDRVNKLLLYRQNTSNSHRGYYGPIHGPTGVSTAPYGRWAATSKDPTRGDLVLATAVLANTIDPGFNKGADDQMGPEYLNDPVGSVRKHGLDRKYWVGPLPGVDPWRTFQYRMLRDVAPDSELGRFLIQRGVAAMSGKRPSWLLLPVCDGNGIPQRRVLPTAGAAFGGLLLGLFVTGLAHKLSRSSIVQQP